MTSTPCCKKCTHPSFGGIQMYCKNKNCSCHTPTTEKKCDIPYYHAKNKDGVCEICNPPTQEGDWERHFGKEFPDLIFWSKYDKLKSFIHSLRQEDLRAVRGMVEEAKITQRPLGWLNDDMVEGYNQALSYILSKLPELD